MEDISWPQALVYCVGFVSAAVAASVFFKSMFGGYDD